MDLLAALALVLVLEGLALAIFANSVPGLMAALDQIGQKDVRRAGILCAVLGGVLYLVIRGGTLAG